MRLEQLYYFETLVREKSFHKAAEKLHITQPSLTANIKTMEKELNKTLLLRGPKMFELTEDGRKVLEFAKTVTLEYQSLQYALNKDTQLVEGKFSVFSSKFISEIILENFMEQFQKNYPNVQINLIENNFHANRQSIHNPNGQLTITSRLFSPQADAVMSDLVVSDEVFFEPNFTYLPLFQDVLGFCASKDSPLMSQPSVTMDSISSEEWPITAFPFQDTKVTDKLLLSSNNIRMHKKAMLEANAYCNLPYFVYRHLFADEKAFMFRAYSKPISIHYYLVYPKNRALSSSEQHFVEELQRFLAQHAFS